MGRSSPRSLPVSAMPCVAALVLLSAGIAHADATKRLQLPNGLRVVLKPSMATDVVAIELLLDISAADEPPDQRGLRNVVQRLLLRGTRAETGEAMARRLARVGGVAEATVGLDYIEVYALAPADAFEVALDVIAQSVQSPAFDPEEVHKQLTSAAEAAAAAHSDPFQETYLAFRETLYHDHPYGGAVLGSPSSLAHIGRDDVIAFHEANYIPNRAVIAICGGVGEARALSAVRRAFGDWSPGIPAPDMPFSKISLKSSDMAARERPVRRAHLMIGFPAPAAGADQYYAVQVIDCLMGGGTTGMLAQRLRDEMGLVYDVSSFYPTLAGESHFVIYAVMDPRQLETVKKAILELAGRLSDTPISEAELMRAKSYLLGSYALSHQRVKDQAYSLGWYEILGLGADFEARYTAGIEAVTPQQVQEAARTCFQHFVLAIVLPEE